MFDVGYDIVHVLDTDREAYQIGGDAGGNELLVVHLAVGRVCRMQDARFRVGDMCRYGCETQFAHEILRRLTAAFEAEGDDAAGTVRQVLLRTLIVLVAGQTAVIDPCDLFMFRKVFRDGLGVGAVPGHAYVKGLETEVEQVSVEGRLHGVR